MVDALLVPTPKYYEILQEKKNICKQNILFARS
jgi:hypothetical protein